MPRIFRESDIDRSRLAGQRIAVIGYGSQGRGQALNLRDSGLDVVVGLRPGGASWTEATAEGWSPLSIEEAAASADLVSILIPDMTQKSCWADRIAPNLRPGTAVLFSHGLAIVYGLISPPADSDVIMIAPKGPGGVVRREFERGEGVPCLVAVHQNPSGHALEKALAYGWGVGGARAAIIETSFREETETDLFGEQAVLCGGVSSLINAGFETLVDAGYAPEIAYFECLHELKLIVDLIFEGGLARMHKYVSDTAQYGDHTRGDRVIDAGTRQRMREILEEIRSGAFAKEWLAEHESGAENYRRMQREDADRQIEHVGRELRQHFSWLRNRNHPSATPTVGTAGGMGQQQQPAAQA